jgi:hypothetical protein
MNCHDFLYECSGPRANSRRWFLKQCGVGLGKIAAASLLADAFVARSQRRGHVSGDRCAPASRPPFSGEGQAGHSSFHGGRAQPA